jgi:predicted component of type VI protein secretion system
MEQILFPFTILVMAPFLGRHSGRWTKGPISVSGENLDQVIADLSLSVEIALPKDLSSNGFFTLPFRNRKDFLPEGILLSNDYLKSIFEARQFVLEAPSKGRKHEEVVDRIKGWKDLPPLSFPDDRRESSAKEKSAIDEILNMVSLPEDNAEKPRQMSGLVDQLDTALRRALERIFQDDEFKVLEGTWAGLQFLLSRIGKGDSYGGVTVKIVPTSPEHLEENIEEILPDLIREIPSLIVVDLPFKSSPRGIALLEKLAGVAETLLVPLLGWIGPDFFHVDSWHDVEKLSYLPHHFERPEFATWQKLRESPAGRWIGITCNGFLERISYGAENQKGPILFQEPGIPWRSPVWAVAALICRSQLEVGWPSRFTEWRKFNLEDLALQRISGKHSAATEVSFDENRIDQMIASGLIPLASFKNKDIAFVLGDPTVSGSSLAFQLILSRIVQFFIHCKESLGTDGSAADLEERLQSALSRFWEATGHPAPKEIHLSVQKSEPAGPASVMIKIRPEPAVLPSGEVIEFHFDW